MTDDAKDKLFGHSEVPFSYENNPEDREMPDLNKRLLDLAVEFPCRAFASQSLDEISFLLTNDLRALLGFDRCLLITHFAGISRIVSATHQPSLDASFRDGDHIGELTAGVRETVTPTVEVIRQTGTDIGEPELPEAQRLLQRHLQWSGAGCVCLLPLLFHGGAVAHVLAEYFGDNRPDARTLAVFVKIAPLLAGALSDRWMAEQHPECLQQIRPPRSEGHSLITKRNRNRLIGVASAVFVCLLLFSLPMTSTVGGEAVIAPKDKAFAFCKVGGLIQSVFVRHGSQVTEDQLVAAMDPKETDFKIRREERQSELLGREIELVRSKAYTDPSVLGKMKLLELRMLSVHAELDFLRMQKSRLAIVSPVSGVVITKDVESLIGKKFEAGEAFCEIATQGSVGADIYIPEDRVSLVKAGQTGHLYLNSEPLTGISLRVEEVSPRAEADQRLGNVFRTTCSLSAPPQALRVGMKGIGTIETGNSTLWSALKRRLGVPWNYLRLHFQHITK